MYLDPNSRENLFQLEAQILIAVTVAVVAYAAKHDLPATPASL